MEPAHTIITAFGGPAKVANILGVHRTRVSKWKSPKAKGGTDGLIPMWHAVKLLKIAEEEGIDIGSHHFFATEETEQKEGASQ